MSRDDLTVRQRAVLFALLGEARQVANPELEQLIGVRLDGAERRELNDRKLVESIKAGRAFAHELSDAGWRWCAKELAAAPGEPRRAAWSARTTSSSAVFARYLDAAGLSLADIVRPDPETPTERRSRSRRSRASRAAEADLTRASRPATVRSPPAPASSSACANCALRLPGRPRPDVDAALAALFTAQRINLIPQSNQQALSDADREAALRIGGEYKHLISIE